MRRLTFSRTPKRKPLPTPSAEKGGTGLLGLGGMGDDKWAYEASKAEPGCVLVWEPPASYTAQSSKAGMEGDYFKHTTVLLIEHSDSVTTGFVLNQPSMHSVREAIAINTLPEVFNEAPVFVGGPIGTSLEMLHRVSEVKNCTKIADGIYYGGDIYHAASLIEEGKARLDEFRLMYRFAGWYPGQLNDEISAGYWRVARASPGLIFDRLPSNLVTPLVRPDSWARLMSKLGGEAARASQKEISGLTDSRVVDMWVSALTNPNPEAGACVIAAMAEMCTTIAEDTESEAEPGTKFTTDASSSSSTSQSEESGSSDMIDIVGYEGYNMMESEMMQKITEEVESKLDDIQRQVMWDLSSQASGRIPGVEERLAALNQALFGSNGLMLPVDPRTAEAMGASITLHSPEHYRIDKALESLQADPALLCVIYMSLARRVGVEMIPVYISQLATKTLLRTESQDGTVYFIDPARNGTAFDYDTVVRDLEAGVRSAAEIEARNSPAAAAAVGWFPDNGIPSGPLNLPSVDGESGLAPLGRIFGQILMALANGCVIRGDKYQGVVWKRVARALQEAVDILEMKDLSL